MVYPDLCRSRKGAWIEITLTYDNAHVPWVAPARERGLKLNSGQYAVCMKRRSRKGAWIEIGTKKKKVSRYRVAPARERGLKFRIWVRLLQQHQVAPARERGLKSNYVVGQQSVMGRSRKGAWIEMYSSNGTEMLH